MTELQPPDGQINGGGTMVVASAENIVTKRQRRPSVRLGDIGGDQSYDSHQRRSNKQHWKQQQQQYQQKDHKSSSSKGRTLMNFSGSEFHETLDGEDKEGNLDSVAIGSWKVRDTKSKRSSIPTAKRVRSNWVSRTDDGGGGGDGDGDDGEKFSGGDDGFRDFDDSESPVKGNSPNHSLDNLEIEREGGHYKRRGSRTRVFEGGIELEGPSDTDGRNWNNNNDNNFDAERNGVKVWLNQLGLGRYAPVFEIHEVDDEVLPMLTLEDLKDMGINAVGSRRKMYSSIQKLGKGFS